MRKLIIILIISFSVAGCSTTIDVLVRGQSDMNRRSRAIVKTYELNNKSSFQEVQRKDFWSEKSSIEGVVESRKIDLYPDSTVTFKLELSDETKYIGVAANLLEPDPPEAWRRVYPVEEVDRLQVTVRNTRITVKVGR